MLKTPSIAIVVGEGGSGGALGIGVTDRVLILENSYYSVITPESCASILWRDAKEAPRASEVLWLGRNHDLKKFGIVEEVIAEPFGGAHNNPASTAAALKKSLIKHIGELRALVIDDLLEKRYDRYRHLGVYTEGGQIRS